MLKLIWSVLHETGGGEGHIGHSVGDPQGHMFLTLTIRRIPYKMYHDKFMPKIPQIVVSNVAPL